MAKDRLGRTSKERKMTKDRPSWEERFVQILNRDYRDDPVCQRIGTDRELALQVGTMMKSYVDKGLTKELAAERKARVGAYRSELVKAVDGLEAAAKLHRHRDPARAAAWQSDAAEFEAELPRADELLDTKRHGRERDHGILDSIRQVLGKRVGPVTLVTLANLVNAGLEADGQDDGDPVTEDDVRKALKHFLDRNPNWDPTGNKDPRK